MLLDKGCILRLRRELFRWIEVCNEGERFSFMFIIQETIKSALGSGFGRNDSESSESFQNSIYVTVVSRLLNDGGVFLS